MGNIEYTIGFYGKVAPGSEDGSPNVPQTVLDNPEFVRVKQKRMSAIEAAVIFTPPSRKWSSGILTIQVIDSITSVDLYALLSFLDPDS